MRWKVARFAAFLSRETRFILARVATLSPDHCDLSGEAGRSGGQAAIARPMTTTCRPLGIVLDDAPLSRTNVGFWPEADVQY